MIKKTIVLIIGVVLLFGIKTYAQTQAGELRGRITDAEKGEPLPFANIIIKIGGTQKGGTSSDIDGNYIIKPISPGTYDIYASYVGYKDLIIKDYEVGGNKISFQDIKLTPSVLTTKEVIIETSIKKLVDQDEGSGGRLSKEEIKKAPTRDVGALVNLTAGTLGNSFKGQRGSGTAYFVDGVRMRGSMGVPQGSIQEINTITGGIPAEYGDLVGGVVSITTKGPSAKFSGGLEGITSQFLDAYGYNVVEGNVSGPLILKNKKAKGTDTAEARLGFLLSGNVNFEKDPAPSAIGVWKLKDDRYDYLYQNPLIRSENGGIVPTAEYMTKNDMELVKAHPDRDRFSYNLTGKLDLIATKNLNIVVGGMVANTNVKGYNYANSMFNYKETSKTVTDYNTYRIYGRLTQKLNFGSDQSSKKKIKISNAYYTLSFDYTKNYNTQQHSEHKDKLFDYNYVGKFEEYRAPVYIRGEDTVGGHVQNAYILQGYRDTSITFAPSSINQSLANYTSQLYKLENGNISNWTDILINQGLRNGSVPTNVYSLWSNIGSPTASYNFYDEEQYAVKAQASADLNKHAIKIGFEYEQRIQSSYFVSSTSINNLWTLMRQLMNSHIQQLDTKNPVPVYDSNGVFLDTINYKFLNDGQQTTFDKNFRNYLKSIKATDVYGNLIDDNSYVNIDRYSPDQFSISMFSPDELLSPQIVSYYGYDYKGNKLTKKPSYEDFLNNPSERLIAPDNPIYVAGFIQDQFVYKDMIFRIGLRLDRFDANQPVLKDKYSLYPTRTVSEVKTLPDGTEVKHPGIMGPDYVVYVDDAFKPTKIIGYRNGDLWYDATGAEVVDPNVLALQTTTGKIAPYLQETNENNLKLTMDAFKDYEPQLNFSPRVYFSFPLSEDANFYANYDVRVQRPDNEVFTHIDDYYYMEDRGTSLLNNAALQPQRITSYELGFKQALTKNTAVSLNAYYNETRNEINLRMINQAYPRSYMTYDNIDFQTTKGISITYDLRKTKNSNISVLANYTLQFSDGTGSNTGSQYNLINAGQPNLRTPFPLDNDNRHNFSAQVDYRYKGGQGYNGPVSKNGFKWLQYTGINLMITGTSGKPYSKQGNVTETQGIGIRQSEVSKGTMNGSRYPWTYNLNLRLDRDFFISYKKIKDKKKIDYSKGMFLNVYIWVVNVLDTRNVAYLYRYTGDPNDDGYLSSSYGLTAIESATYYQAFYDQYSIKVNSPTNYVAPRIIRLGATLSF
jgi:hypothetical protein